MVSTQTPCFPVVRAVRDETPHSVALFSGHATHQSFSSSNHTYRSNFPQQKSLLSSHRKGIRKCGKASFQIAPVCVRQQHPAHTLHKLLCFLWVSFHQHKQLCPLLCCEGVYAWVWGQHHTIPQARFLAFDLSLRTSALSMCSVDVSIPFHKSSKSSLVALLECSERANASRGRGWFGRGK
jgi:hypothetical protein